MLILRMALLPAALVAGCTDSPDVPAVEDVLSLQDITDTSIELNACQGQGQLLYRGATALPGDPCGACNDGRLSCAGPEALECTGGTEPNDCRSCGELRGTPGLPCGFCAQGQWTCEAGTVECAADRQPNTCGGCALLPVEPGVLCGTEREPATWRCITPEEVRCVPDNANACGGNVVLTDVVGSLCGTCNRGSIICDGLDATSCGNPESGVNACGGCQELLAVPGDACGDCGGNWTCNDDGTISCSITRNGCGSCGTLDATPGEPCDGGVWACATTRSLECRDEGTNPCGGVSTLEQRPGAPCGECADGTITCLSPEQTVCVGAGTRNSCGGCGPMPGEPGELCSAGAVFVCNGNTTACSLDIGLNACGGTAELTGAPGDACGLCNTGTLACAGVSSLLCEGESTTTPYEWYPDRDGDGFGDAEAPVEVLCEEPTSGYSRTNDDCNDDDELFYPDAPEDACSAEDDFNCDGEVLFVDEDRDGVSACFDCDDRNRRVRPDAPEVCDSLDNNCNDDIDEGAGRLWYQDFDADGHGNPDVSIQACARPEGYVSIDDDCDDDNAARFPGNREICDNIDNNCDFVIDGETAIDRDQFYPDRDGDSFGDPRATPLFACERPDGYVLNADDCDDSTEDINPSATEECDGADNNCDRIVDLDAVDRQDLYVDADRDGFGNNSLPTLLTCPIEGFTTIIGDCDDQRASVNPSARDIPGDGFDQNCDGREFCAVDVDGDGFIGDFSLLIESPDLNCTGLAPCPDGVTPFRGDGQCFLAAAVNPATDCDELDPSINPAQTEDFGDGVDSNCDGSEICYRDVDDDGWRPSASAIQVSDNASCLDSGEATEDDPVGDCLDEGSPQTLSGSSLSQVWNPAEINPGSTIESDTNRRLDGIDYNCSGTALCYVDADRDRFHNNVQALVTSTEVTTMCSPTNRRTRFEPAELPLCDNRADINPSVVDTPFDGVDSNCDRQELCYIDDDQDGFMTTSTTNTFTVTDPTELDILCTGRRNRFPGPGTIGVIVRGAGGGLPAGGDCVDDSAIAGANAVRPNRNDLPGFDTAYAELDTDCDGRDGNRDFDLYLGPDNVCRIFDGAGTETTFSNCTVGEALFRCSQRSGCAHAFLLTGNYTMASTLGLQNGIGLQGGYTDGYTARDNRVGDSITARRSRIDFTGSLEYAVQAHSLSRTTVVDTVRFDAPNGSSWSAGTPNPIINSVGFSVLNSGQSGGTAYLQVVNSYIQAGTGGTPAAGAAGIAGASGGNASARDGGSPDYAACGYDYGGRCGSFGGGGSAFDDASASSCKFSICGMSCRYSISAVAGSGGGSGGTAGGTGTRRCNCYDSDPNSGDGGTGGTGNAGACAGTTGGNGGSLSGTVSNGSWSPSFGTGGNNGGGGSGGGGGGAGGGYCYCSFGGSSTCHDSGRGGGGGAGGNGATGGGAGRAGGASIGVLLQNSFINLSNTTIVRRKGGTGSQGGRSANGGGGGSNAGGGPKACCGGDDAGNGGRGGNGGGGGASSPGNGGDGGASYGVFRSNSTVQGTPIYTSNCTGGSCPGNAGSAGDSTSTISTCASATANAGRAGASADVN